MIAAGGNCYHVPNIRRVSFTIDIFRTPGGDCAVTMKLDTMLMATVAGEFAISGGRRAGLVGKSEREVKTIRTPPNAVGRAGTGPRCANRSKRKCPRYSYGYAKEA